MEIFLTTTESGIELKNIISEYLKSLKFNVVDLTSTPALDFVDSADLLAKKIKEDESSLGIAFDAYGAGSFIVANKHKGIIVAESSDEWSAHMTRRHNNARIITIGSQIVGVELAKNIVKTFVSTDYDGGRHQIRVDMLNAMC